MEEYFLTGAAVWRAKFSLLRLFQRLFGELSMGNWISYSGRVWEHLKFNDSWLEKIIDAHIHYMTLPMILNYAGPTIVRTPHLNEYFSKFPAYQKYRDHYWRLVVGEYGYVTRDDFLEKLRELADLPEVDDVFSKIKDGVVFIGEVLAAKVLDAGLKLGLGDRGIVLWIDRVLAKPLAWGIDYLTHVSNLYSIDPFLPLHFAIIVSQIALLQSYRAAIEKLEERGYVPAYLPRQLVLCLSDDKEIARTQVDEYGKGSFWLSPAVLEKIPMKREGE